MWQGETVSTATVKPPQPFYIYSSAFCWAVWIRIFSKGCVALKEYQWKKKSSWDSKALTLSFYSGWNLQKRWKPEFPQCNLKCIPCCHMAAGADRSHSTGWLWIHWELPQCFSAGLICTGNAPGPAGQSRSSWGGILEFQEVRLWNYAKDGTKPPHTPVW